MFWLMIVVELDTRVSDDLTASLNSQPKLKRKRRAMPQFVCLALRITNTRNRELPDHPKFRKKIYRGQPMSNARWQTVFMTMKNKCPLADGTEVIVGFFGKARPVLNSDDKCEVRGGNEVERQFICKVPSADPHFGIRRSHATGDHLRVKERR